MGRGRMSWEPTVNTETHGNKQLTQLLTPGDCGKQGNPETTLPLKCISSCYRVGPGLIYIFVREIGAQMAKWVDEGAPDSPASLSDIPFPQEVLHTCPQSTAWGTLLAHLLLRTACEVATLTSLMLQVRDLSKSQVYRLQSLCNFFALVPISFLFRCFLSPIQRQGLS